MSTDLRNHPDLSKAPFVDTETVTIRDGDGRAVGQAPVDEPRSTDPVAYLQGDEDGSVWLVCEDAGCMVAGSCYSRLCFLQIELPFRCSPWQAAGALTAHLREAHRGA